MTSTRTELAQLAEQWISLWNPPVDWALFDALHAADFEDAAAAGRASAKAGFAQGLRAFVEAFPDLRTRVEDLVIETATGKVAIRWSAQGTNRARYLGIGPTQRLTHITGIEIIALRDGRIVRRWGEWDISDHAPR